MSNIEDTINNNPGAFSNEEPPQGHLNRFEQRLTPENKILWPVLKAAAGILLIVSLSMAFYYRQVADNVSLRNISMELAETESFYESVFNKKLEQAETMLNPEQFKTVKKELKVMDQNYLHLKNDFKMNPDDQRIIHAMINHYQLKIELVVQVMAQINAIKNSKYRGYDTEQT